VWQYSNIQNSFVGTADFNLDSLNIQIFTEAGSQQVRVCVRAPTLCAYVPPISHYMNVIATQSFNAVRSYSDDLALLVAQGLTH
jgi:hypothetical protein